MTPRFPRRPLYVFGLIPFFPFVIAFLVHLPFDAAGVVHLDGTWNVADAAPLDPGSPPTTTTLRVPGPLPRDLNRPVIRRRFTLDAAPTEPLLLVLGGFSSLVGEIFVNGRFVGSEGDPARGYKLEHVPLDAYFVPRELVVTGENEVEVRFTAEGEVSVKAGPFGNLVDRRLLIGPSSVVRPWFDRTHVLERLLDLGSIALLLFLAGLVIILSVVERDPASRRVQRISAFLALAIVVYLAGKAGLALALGLSRDVVPKAITLIALLMLELVELAMHGRVSVAQKVNRVVCGAHLLTQFTVDVTVIYQLFIPYLFVVIVYGTAVALRGAFRLRTMEAMLLAGSFLAVAVAGVNDLLTDINVLATPRLFTLAAVDVGVIAAVFVVSRFVRAMQDNAELLAHVEEKNVALSSALVRAEESTRLKSAFLANTSHELRTPLNSIINVPEGLLEEFVQRPFVSCRACASLFEAPEGHAVKDDDACPECGATGSLVVEHRAVFAGDPEAAMRYLRAIQQSGRHLLEVVNDILDFSKLEAGRMVVHVERCPLDAQLEKLALAMLPLAETRAITLDVARVDPTITMRTDATKLTQVLMNLVSNAIKFSPEGSAVHVTAAIDDDTVTLAVVDRGIGIAREDQARVFESFRQLDNSHTRKVGGTGLGLAISKRIVELLGGSIALESEPGRGTTFTVRLPRGGPPPPAADGAAIVEEGAR